MEGQEGEVSGQGVICFVLTRLLYPRVRQHVIWYGTDVYCHENHENKFFLQNV